MRNKIVFVMAMAGMCCTLQAKANVQPVPQDSVPVSYTHLRAHET